MAGPAVLGGLAGPDPRPGMAGPPDWGGLVPDNKVLFANIAFIITKNSLITQIYFKF